MRRVSFFVFIFLISHVAMAGINWAGLETLAKQKDPERAVKKISEIYKQGPLEPRVQLSVQRIANKIFETFYTEKGLNYYEVGKHLAVSDSKEAKVALAKGMDLEPYNGKIFLLWARISLMRGECGFTESNTAKLLEAYPHADELHLLVGQDLACQEKESELEAWLADNKDLNAPLKKFLVHLEVRLYAMKKDSIKMSASLENLAQLDSSFSELVYWQSQIEEKNMEYKQELVDKYVAACSNMTEKARREHLIEPLTCAGARDLKERKKNG